MSKDKLHGILRVASPLISLLSAVMCALTFGYAFDKGIGYFNTNHPLTYIFYITLALSVIIAILSAVTAPKIEDASSEAPNRKVMGIILMCSFAFYLISFALSPKPDYMVIPLANKLKIDLYSSITVGATISVAHFALLAFSPIKSLKDVKIVTGLAPIITAILIATASYFDHSQTINSPIKLLLEFALAAFALYYVLELRFYTPVKRRGLFIAISGISIALSLCGGVAMMFQMLHYTGFTLLNFATAILLATLSSCTASKLLQS